VIDQLKLSFLLFFTVLLILGACQRKHDNIFDPDNKLDSLDLHLKISRSDSIVTLRWWKPATVSYQGFNLFRKTEDETAFRIIATLPADSLEFNDTDVQFETKYTYFLNVFGEDVESPPTRLIKTTPGAEKIWVLDYWNFYILNLTFDLQHVSHKHYAIWRPKAMSFTDDEKTALVMYPGYQYFELFNPQTNAYLHGSDVLERPFDCLFVPSQNKFYVSDSTSGIYSIDPADFSLHSITNTVDQPTYLSSGMLDKLLILDGLPGKLMQFDPDNEILSSIDVLGDSIINFVSDLRQQRILAINRSSGQHTLNSYLNGDSSLSVLYADSALARVRVSSFDGTLWISLNYQNSAELVQLSANGLRLNSLNGFDYISDFNISPKTGYLVIADMSFNTNIGTIHHIHTDGTVIGTSTEAYYPYRIYIR